MLHLQRALLVGLTSFVFGCSSTIIVGSPPDTDAGFPVADALFPVTDVPGTSGEVGVVLPIDVPIITDTSRPFDDARRTCTSTAQCGRNEVCLGMPGCGVPWVCTQEPGRVCTGDFAPFCGCDGQTFYASSTCPDRPYQSRGGCPITPPPFDGGGPTPTGCVLANGSFCGRGETCRVDECTICRCTARGLECAGSGACRDAGPVRDVGVRRDDGPGSCTVRGVTCAVGSTCRVSPEIVCFCAAPDRPECRVIGTDAGVVPTDAGVPVRDVVTPDAGDVCASQDARGEGFCELFLGVYWMRNRCVGVSGCRCVGADCGRSYMSFVACEEAHSVCRR